MSFSAVCSVCSLRNLYYLLVLVLLLLTESSSHGQTRHVKIMCAELLSIAFQDAVKARAAQRRVAVTTLNQRFLRRALRRQFKSHSG